MEKHKIINNLVVYGDIRPILKAKGEKDSGAFSSLRALLFRRSVYINNISIRNDFSLGGDVLKIVADNRIIYENKLKENERIVNIIQSKLLDTR